MHTPTYASAILRGTYAPLSYTAPNARNEITAGSSRLTVLTTVYIHGCPQAWERGHFPLPGNVVKCSCGLVTTVSGDELYLCIIFKTCRQLLGTLSQGPNGAPPRTLLGDFRYPDPLICPPGSNPAEAHVYVPVFFCAR